MKKVLLASILSFVINVSAQNKQTIINLQFPASKTSQKVQDWMNKDVLQISGMSSESVLGQSIKHQNREKVSQIKINDSILYWNYNQYNPELKLTNKIINMVYDNKNNLVSETYQSLFNGVWENTSRYTYTYDTYNSITSEVAEYMADSAWVYSWRTIYIFDANNNKA